MVHPREDFAGAHQLHIIATRETARVFDMTVATRETITRIAFDPNRVTEMARLVDARHSLTADGRPIWRIPAAVNHKMYPYFARWEGMYQIDTVCPRAQRSLVVRKRISAVVAIGLALLLISPAMAKTAHHGHHTTSHSERHYAQSYYDYRSASLVREEFADAPRGRWMAPPQDEYFEERFYQERRDSRVVENLRSDFTGGVGYGADGGGFVDGYGQTHFFVGSFRRMNRLPHGPFMPNRFGMGRRGF
jgi:hypothetical protein